MSQYSFQNQMMTHLYLKPSHFEYSSYTAHKIPEFGNKQLECADYVPPGSTPLGGQVRCWAQKKCSDKLIGQLPIERCTGKANTELPWNSGSLFPFLYLIFNFFLCVPVSHRVIWPGCICSHSSQRKTHITSQLMSKTQPCFTYYLEEHNQFISPYSVFHLSVNILDHIKLDPVND